MKKMTCTSALIILLALTAHGQTLPVIPDGEAIRYKTMKGKNGESIEYSSQTIRRVNEEGVDYFLIRSNSPDQSVESRIAADSFIPVTISKRLTGGRSEISTTTSLLTAPSLERDEIAILDMADLAHVLRAYPFENPRDMTLVFLGQEGGEMGEMAFRIVYEGEETIRIKNRPYEAWKLELKADLSGAMAIFAAMIPKTYLWFSRGESRHLLKMTGSEGPGADRKIELEMISYSR